MRIYLAIIVLFLFACKKENKEPAVTAARKVYDTIKPRPYFPAIPGSFWKYQTHDNINITDSILRELKLVAWPGGDSAFLPFYHGTIGYWAAKGAYIGGYDRGCVGYRPPVEGMPDYRVSVFLSESTDTLDISLPCDPRYGCIRERLALSQKKVDEKGDSILVVKGYFYIAHGAENSPRSERSYRVYKKGVGLTFECVTYVETGDTIFRRRLIEHRIGG